MKYIQLKNTDPAIIELLKNFTDQRTAATAIAKYLEIADMMIKALNENQRLKDERYIIRENIDQISSAWNNLKNFKP